MQTWKRKLEGRRPEEDWGELTINDTPIFSETESLFNGENTTFTDFENTSFITSDYTAITSDYISVTLSREEIISYYTQLMNDSVDYLTVPVERSRLR